MSVSGQRGTQGLMPEFFQDPPRLGNQYDDDALLRAYLRWRLPANMLAELEPDLQRLGHRAVTDILALGELAEASPPRHIAYDAWGCRVDRIETSDAWRELDRISATEGIVATGYERTHGAHSRIHQFARLYLFAPSSALYSCPLAMTDGAARFLEVHGDKNTQPTFAHLTSRDPNEFWTSGQWMTERTGGSDVGSTSTIARCDKGDTYSLYGSKWFTSATTSQVAMTLARIEGTPAGSRGLSAFLINLRDSNGKLRNIRIERLKDKLGTRALPTAELTLEGTPAQLVGGAGDGIRKIATLFNITRVYNAVAGVAGMRRAVALASDYARRRRAFGKPLIEHPLHVETLAEMHLELRAAFLLAFRVVELLGRDESGNAAESESQLLRFLIPVAKLYTAKQAIAVASEALEAFGGAGYVEDTGIPRLLRDAQVLSIWEGTTNILSLDALRAMERTDALAVWTADVKRRLSDLKVSALSSCTEPTLRAVQRIEEYAGRARTAESEFQQAGARGFAFAVARTEAAALLVEQANAQGDHAAVTAARRWCARELAPLVEADAEHRAGSVALEKTTN
ncbi:MAG: acyl-CoA dehydrogenase family protein [Gemmatimonadota bacterium]|nr:acyl-CoA dehydrogenase family protein [Gemmatimonadota bacterium]